MLLPILLVLVVAALCTSAWFVYAAAHPPLHPYLVMPADFAHVSPQGAKVTEETWPNSDGTQARGWLLRGGEGSPAIVLLHRYGADRSWLLNLGIKLNEATTFTVLWPDLRGHGENPKIPWTSFGPSEADDTLAALEYVASLKTPQGKPLVAGRVGLYGVELGAYAAILAATRTNEVSAMVLDSVPASRDDIVQNIIADRTGLSPAIVRKLSLGGTRIYFQGKYESTPTCDAAGKLVGVRGLLLSGNDAGVLRGSTESLVRCFPNPSLWEVDVNLSLTGYNIPSATGQQSETYDRRVINYFDMALRKTR